jgi:2,4-dienoyl-CoA reductase (NADPH2)
LDNVFREKSCTCLVNSRVGREAETKISPAATSKKVLVVGGGVAGMEAARVAASRGHDVTLWEKKALVGGALMKAGAVPDRIDLYDLVDYLIESLSVLGVNVKLNQEAKVEEIRSFAPDVVVFATGSTPFMPPIPGIELGHVVEAGEILLGKVKEIGRRVVIVGGGAVGCEIGIYIAKQGTIDSDMVKFLLLNEAEAPETIKELATRGTKEVYILEMDKAAGRGLGISTRWSMLQDLKRMGVNILTSTVVQTIKPDGVVITRADGKPDKIPADSVIIAVGSQSENWLYEELQGEFPEVYLIGDARKVRTALDAVREGFDIGYSI